MTDLATGARGSGHVTMHLLFTGLLGDILYLRYLQVAPLGPIVYGLILCGIFHSHYNHTLEPPLEGGLKRLVSQRRRF